MKFKDIPLPRRIFRSILLVFLGASTVFFFGIVALRVAYKDQGIEGAMQTKVLQADIMQHHARAYFADDAGDMVIAEELLRLSIFSRLYGQAGIKMLEEKAENGYQPALDRLAELQN